MTRYAVLTWIPGYLPESDDEWTTDDLTTARQVLASEIERDWDADYAYAYDVDDTAADLEAIDARYLDADTAVNTVAPDEAIYVPAPSWQTHGLGRNYAIVTVEEG